MANLTSRVPRATQNASMQEIPRPAALLSLVSWFSCNASVSAEVVEGIKAGRHAERIPRSRMTSLDVINNCQRSVPSLNRVAFSHPEFDIAECRF